MADIKKMRPSLSRIHNVLGKQPLLTMLFLRCRLIKFHLYIDRGNETVEQ